MVETSSKERRTLEIVLILVCIGLACLLHSVQGYKIAVLNLFFLPVVLGAFFLGRYRGGILALFSAIAAALVTAYNLPAMTSSASPLVLTLAVTVWAAALGLTGMLVGTLSDDRAAKNRELHEAYVGVVEVLSQYLQSAHPRLKARSIQVAELSQQVAVAMQLSPRQIDDIRVAALLYDMGNIEVTTKVIRRAVATFEDDTDQSRQRTFQGLDLMLSLGSVLSGAVPLLLNQDEELAARNADGPNRGGETPIGAKIIRVVRAYVTLLSDGAGRTRQEVIQSLRTSDHDAGIVELLERVVTRHAPASADKAEPYDSPHKAAQPGSPEKAQQPAAMPAPTPPATPQPTAPGAPGAADTASSPGPVAAAE